MEASLRDLEMLRAPWFEARRAGPDQVRRMLSGSARGAMICAPDALMEMRRPPAEDSWRWGGFKAGAWMSSQRALEYLRAGWGPPDQWTPGRYRKAANFVFETPDVLIGACLEPGARGNFWWASLKEGGGKAGERALSTEMAAQWPVEALAQLGVALSQIALRCARASGEAAEEIEGLAPGWIDRAKAREASDPEILPRAARRPAP